MTANSTAGERILSSEFRDAWSMGQGLAALPAVAKLAGFSGGCAGWRWQRTRLNGSSGTGMRIELIYRRSVSREDAMDA